MSKPIEKPPSLPDPVAFVESIVLLHRVRITENELYMPEPIQNDINSWEGSRQGIGRGKQNSLIYRIDQKTRRISELGERKTQKMQLGPHITVTCDWWEFKDREAKSFYWSEVLRRKAIGSDTGS